MSHSESNIPINLRKNGIKRFKLITNQDQIRNKEFFIISQNYIRGVHFLEAKAYGRTYKYNRSLLNQHLAKNEVYIKNT